MEELKKLLGNNARWAQSMVDSDTGFFKRLEEQQNPEYLWIGCSDSRVPANEILGMAPAERERERSIAACTPPQP